MPPGQWPVCRAGASPAEDIPRMDGLCRPFQPPFRLALGGCQLSFWKWPALDQKEVESAETDAWRLTITLCNYVMSVHFSPCNRWGADVTISCSADAEAAWPGQLLSALPGATQNQRTRFGGRHPGSLDRRHSDAARGRSRPGSGAFRHLEIPSIQTRPSQPKFHPGQPHRWPPQTQQNLHHVDGRDRRGRKRAKRLIFCICLLAPWKL